VCGGSGDCTVHCIANRSRSIWASLASMVACKWMEAVVVASSGEGLTVAAWLAAGSWYPERPVVELSMWSACWLPGSGLGSPLWFWWQGQFVAICNRLQQRDQCCECCCSHCEGLDLALANLMPSSSCLNKVSMAVGGFHGSTMWVCCRPVQIM
jgi:hypothetical protein